MRTFLIYYTFVTQLGVLGDGNAYVDLPGGQRMNREQVEAIERELQETRSWRSAAVANIVELEQ